MNTNHKHISKDILMNSVIQDPFKEVQRKFKQYNIIQDDSYFDYELLKAALDRRHQAIIKLLLKLNCRVRNPNKINSEDTVLHRAMKIDKSEIIIKILRNGASIYDKNMRGETAVYVAFKDGYHYSVNTVLKFVYLNNTGFKHLNPLNKDDVNHFNIACALNNVSVVTQFLNYRFNINFPFTLDYPGMNGVYPLHYAVKKNYSNLFELFLRYGADLTVKNSKGQTPLHILYYSGCFGLSMMASAFNSENETKFINSVDDNGVSHFHLCCTVNNPGAVKLFIDKGVDINSATSVTEYSPLHLAVMHDCYEVMELLLENGADCNKADAKGATPLHLACEKANPTGEKIIQKLLDYGASTAVVDKRGRTALHLAFYKKQHLTTTNVFDNLISKIPRTVNFTDVQGLSHFHILCTRGDTSAHKSRVQDFLESGVTVDSCVVSGFYSGYTALHFAVLFSQCFTAELLLEKNAQVNIKTSQYKLTPLHIACTFDKSAYVIFGTNYIHRKTNLIKSLLQYKANVNITNSNSETPLHMFIESLENIDFTNHLSKCQEILCSLLDCVSDLCARDKKVRTMFQIALKKNLAFVIEKLLYYGADINIADLSDNLSARSLANTNSTTYLEIFQIIFIHVKKLLALGLFVNEKLQKVCTQLHQHYRTMSSNNNLDNIFDNCVEELERMKCVKIDESTSLYSILVKNSEGLAKHLNNSNLVKILEDENTYNNFPLYTFLLKVPFKKALISVQESSDASLPSVTDLNLPEIEEITDLPKIEEITDLPKIEEITDLPEIEEITDLPKIEEITDLPEIEEITDSSDLQPFKKLKKEH